jgi:hypothetical protein
MAQIPQSGRSGRGPPNKNLLPSKYFPTGPGSSVPSSVPTHSGGDPSSPNAVSSDEQRLNLAYSQYLHHTLLNLLVKDVAKMQAMVSRLHTYNKDRYQKKTVVTFVKSHSLTTLAIWLDNLKGWRRGMHQEIRRCGFC